jgi:hypothetical protein
MLIAMGLSSRESPGAKAQAMGDPRMLLPQIRITQVFSSNLKPVNKTLGLSIKRLPGVVL